MRMLLALTTLVSVGCASAPQTGIRPEFQSHTLRRIAVVPFYAQSNFSLSPEQLAGVLHDSEQAAVASLRARGFDVVSPTDFRAQLKRVGAASLFDEGIFLRFALTSYFEPSRNANGPSLEVATLAQLNTDGALQVDALLLGEVVYHTRTTCREDPTHYNSHAAVSAPQTPVPSQGAPCVVSHFQAKLVYVPTGETMWFNRMLLQTYLEPAAQDANIDNMAQAVSRTLDGPDGLANFETPEATDSLKNSVATE